MLAERAEAAVARGLRAQVGAPSGALVLGSDYRALGVVRSLGRRGVPVRVLASGDDRLATYSRYAVGVAEWPAAEDDQLTLLDRLARSDGHTWALIPSADESAAFVARNHEQLARTFVVTTPPWHVLRWSYDKRCTHELAVAAGVDYPATIYPRDRRDLERSLVRFPVVLKPSVKPTFNRFTAAKAWRADDRATLLRRYDEACELVDPDTLFVQELIGGGGTTQLSYAALADAGEVLCSLVAQRTRQYPADFGRASTFVETIEDPGIADRSRRLIEACSFSGLIEIEYKVDAATGRTLLLDLNPRVWGWHTLSARAGVDFPWLLWLRLCGEDLPEVSPQPGVRWARLSTDLPTSLSEIVHRRLSLRTYLNSLRPPLESAIFAWDDPRPGLLELPLLLRTLIRRLNSHGAV